MFNLGFAHLFTIFVVALVVFGPEKLPELAKMAARMIAELRRMSSDLRSTVNETVASIDPDTPQSPSLRSMVAQMDPRRLLDEAPPRPFASTPPGMATSAPPATDATPAMTGDTPRAMGDVASHEAVTASEVPPSESVPSEGAPAENNAEAVTAPSAAIPSASPPAVPVEESMASIPVPQAPAVPEGRAAN